MILRGSLYSKVLEMETGVTILTPADFRQARPYRVAYILHGLHGNNGDWTNYTRLPWYARTYNLVCIMPEVSRSFYTDMQYGQQFFTYVSEELPALCEATFNISADAKDTAVIGGSMGGYGALKCALSRPEKFGMCAAMSSACLFLKAGLDQMRKPGGKAQASKIYSNQLVRDFQGAFGPDFEWRRDNEILELAAAAQKAGTLPKIYMTCGEQDDLHVENRAFVKVMAESGMPVVYEEFPGVHDWTFFDKALEKSLAFCFGDENEN